MVRVWPAPVPPVMVSVEPTHSLGVHWVIWYVEEASGTVLQALAKVSWLSVFVITVRVWPAPVPPVIVTLQPAHWLGFQLLVVSLKMVFSELLPVDVPLAPTVWLLVSLRVVAVLPP